MRVSRLILTLHDLTSNFDHKLQTDLHHSRIFKDLIILFRIKGSFSSLPLTAYVVRLPGLSLFFLIIQNYCAWWVSICGVQCHLRCPPRFCVGASTFSYIYVNDLSDNISPRGKRSYSIEELRNDFPQTSRPKVGARDWGNTCNKTSYF